MLFDMIWSLGSRRTEGTSQSTAELNEWFNPLSSTSVECENLC